jgi:hypothetical protein
MFGEKCLHVAVHMVCEIHSGQCKIKMSQITATNVSVEDLEANGHVHDDMVEAFVCFHSLVFAFFMISGPCKHVSICGLQPKQRCLWLKSTTDQNSHWPLICNKETDVKALNLIHCG